MRVDLGIFEEDFFGLILPGPSGVVWRNQVGGAACSHPELEGIFVPLPMHLPDASEDPLRDVYMTERNGDYSTILVQQFLDSEGWLAECFEPLEQWADVPSPRLLAEAWVPVRVRGHMPPDGGDSDILAPFLGREVVLVYTNSD